MLGAQSTRCNSAAARDEKPLSLEGIQRKLPENLRQHLVPRQKE